MENFEKYRCAYKPVLPNILQSLCDVHFISKKGESVSKEEAAVKKQFPCTYQKNILQLTKTSSPVNASPMRIGVVFSGGQASGGHNVVTGLYDALMNLDSGCELLGFLNGPSGIVNGDYISLNSDVLAPYRNQGGFDLLGSGRTKIETEEQMKTSLEVFNRLELDGLVVIGGDDSNTNAALLAERCEKEGCKTRVIGVPKTIDGDLKNKYVEISFGFHTATSVYAEMIGNIARDAASAKKYTHFIKLMGRSASHIALECALKTHPNVCLIGEEVANKQFTLKDITNQIADILEKRSVNGKNYGVILIPEGLIEFIPEMRYLIDELNILLANHQNIEDLTPQASNTFQCLPKDIQQQLLLDRDPHGNVQVSHIETERLLSELVSQELKNRSSYQGGFSPVHHFFGYEGRAGLPTNFDATYCYALGIISALLIRDGYTGYMTAVESLIDSPSEWTGCGIPITSLMNFEIRKGKKKIVIEKALVDLSGPVFNMFKSSRDQWHLEDAYQYPGPIQFEGPYHIINSVPLSIFIK